MAEEQQFKRHTAYKFRIGDILVGKPTTNNTGNGERFAFLELGDKKIVRVNIIGNVVDKYESAGETRYISLTVDDGSGQIKVKAFFTKLISSVVGLTILLMILASESRSG